MFRFENRRLDPQNRIVLPAEALSELGIPCEGELTIRVAGDSIILTAPEPQCCLCGRMTGVVRRGRYAVCESCLREIEENK